MFKILILMVPKSLLFVVLTESFPEKKAETGYISQGAESHTVKGFN